VADICNSLKTRNRAWQGRQVVLCVFLSTLFLAMFNLFYFKPQHLPTCRQEKGVISTKLCNIFEKMRLLTFFYGDVGI
jgi:hypothetical protein